MNRCNAITDLFLPVFATFLSKDSKCFINPPQSYILPLFNIKMKRQQFYLTIKKTHIQILKDRNEFNNHLDHVDPIEGTDNCFDSHFLLVVVSQQ